MKNTKIKNLLYMAAITIFAVQATAEVKIGQSCALSGPAEGLGIEMKRGADAFFADHKDIKLESLDDKYEPEKCVENTKKFIEDKDIISMFGYVGTPTSKAALPSVMTAKKVFFGPFTGAGFLSDAKENPYSFSVRASYDQETELMVERLTKDLGAKKIAGFFQDDAFGDVGKSGTVKALEKRKMTLVAEGRYKRNTIAVKEGADAVLAANPDAIIEVGAYKPCAASIKYFRSKGFKGPIINISFVGSESLSAELEGARENLYVTQVVPNPWDAKIPVVKEYQSKVKDKFGFVSLEGFITAKLFSLAVAKAGKTPTSDSLKKALEGLSVDLGGLKASFSESKHRALDKVYFTKIKDDGSFEYVDKIK